MSRTWLCILVVLASATAVAAPPPAPSAAADGNWTMPAHDYANTRFSPLASINRANVGALKVEFTFSTGVNRGQEAAPIVVGDTMYIAAPYPNKLFALDLTKPGAPTKWSTSSRRRSAPSGRCRWR